MSIYSITYSSYPWTVSPSTVIYYLSTNLLTYVTKDSRSVSESKTSVLSHILGTVEPQVKVRDRFTLLSIYSFVR